MHCFKKFFALLMILMLLAGAAAAEETVDISATVNVQYLADVSLPQQKEVTSLVGNVVEMLSSYYQWEEDNDTIAPIGVYGVHGFVEAASAAVVTVTAVTWKAEGNTVEVTVPISSDGAQATLQIYATSAGKGAVVNGDSAVIQLTDDGELIAEVGEGLGFTLIDGSGVPLVKAFTSGNAQIDYDTYGELPTELEILYNGEPVQSLSQRPGESGVLTVRETNILERIKEAIRAAYGAQHGQNGKISISLRKLWQGDPAASGDEAVFYTHEPLNQLMIVE